MLIAARSAVQEDAVAMDAKKPPCEAYRFDRFTLDLARGMLLASDGAELPLRPKSFALLQFLVENAGRLLNRDAIMRTVWPDVFVTDDSIAQCVRDIRRALGDEAQRLLRTMQRRGYLFNVQVSRIEPPMFDRLPPLPTTPPSDQVFEQVLPLVPSEDQPRRQEQDQPEGSIGR